MVNELTLKEANELSAAWIKHPPAHMLLHRITMQLDQVFSGEASPLASPAPAPSRAAPTQAPPLTDDQESQLANLMRIFGSDGVLRGN